MNKELVKAYKKERARVLSLVRRYTKKGYDVELNIPSIPKKITKGSINRLKKLTPKYVKSHSFAPDIETGEKMEMTILERKIKKERKREKEIEIKIEHTPHEYELALDYFENVVGNYVEKAEELIMAKYKSLIAVYGRKLVGEMISELIKDGELLAPNESYNYRAAMHLTNEMAIRMMMTKEEREKIKELQDEENYYIVDGEEVPWD